MILVLFTVFGIALVPVFGGRFRRLGGLRVHGTWVIGAAFGAQLVLLAALRNAPAWETDTIHLATYIVAGGFVWRNRHLTGLPVAALGGISNFVAITANGGVMPASPTSLRLAGKVLDPTKFTNSGPMAHARLQVLGDVIPMPWPHSLANVFSIGDVLLITGVLIVVHSTCGSSLRRRGGRQQETPVPSIRLPDTTSPTSIAGGRIATVGIGIGVGADPAEGWRPPLPPPPTSAPSVAATSARAARNRTYPIDLLPLDHPADGRALVDAFG